MSISTGPVPTPPKKRGWGCLGCGCAVLILLAVLFFGAIGGIVYVGYRTVIQLSTATAPAIPTFNDSDDLYAKVRQKLADFDHDVTNHQAATIRLSADEINTIVTHDPDAIKNKIHVFVSFSGTEGRVQASCPTDIFFHVINGRYISIDTSFDVHHNTSTKSLEVNPHTLQISDKPLYSSSTDVDPSTQGAMRSFVTSFNQQLNLGIRKNPDGAALLDQAKTIEIKGGQLVIETQ